MTSLREFATAAAEKSAYSDYWSNNSGSFQAQGCYEWMAGQLDEYQPKSIFDIGCGTGEGLLALHNRFGCDVLGIDENQQCLRRSHRLFRQHGVNIGMLFRFNYRQNVDQTHVIRIDGSPLVLSEPINLVQADLLLSDPPFEEYLISKAPFDAITIWLIGTYKFRFNCENLFPLRISSPQEYRLHIQNRAYAMAARLLRPGGVLQVVDRSEALKTKELQEDALTAHSEQAALGELEVLRVTSRPYVERATGKGVSMVLSPGTSGRLPDVFETAMCSVISIK